LAEVNLYLDEKYNNFTKIYTDGSKCPDTGKVASAVVIPTFNYEKTQRLSNFTSIYTAELIGIKNALMWIYEHKHSNTVILSDSLSSLVSIKSGNSRSRPDILTDILEINHILVSCKLKTVFVWCPAHIGVYGNELADRAAKSGLSHPTIDNSVKLAPTEVYSMVRKNMLERWEKSLNERLPDSGYSVGLGRPMVYSDNFRVDKCITRLRLGTNLLPGSAGQHILKVDPICPQCRVKYTVTHFLTECSMHKEHLIKLKSSLTALNINFITREILFPSKSLGASVFKALETYILDCQMSDKI
jgi:ribonuclease HI